MYHIEGTKKMWCEHDMHVALITYKHTCTVSVEQQKTLRLFSGANFASNTKNLTYGTLQDLIYGGMCTGAKIHLSALKDQISM